MKNISETNFKISENQPWLKLTTIFFKKIRPNFRQISCDHRLMLFSRSEALEAGKSTLKNSTNIFESQAWTKINKIFRLFHHFYRRHFDDQTCSCSCLLNSDLSSSYYLIMVRSVSIYTFKILMKLVASGT